MTQKQAHLFQKTEKKRAVVYVDGFNFYHGSISGTPHKWLDLQKFFELLRNNDNVILIRYFTAQMHGQQGVRQQTYLQALDTLPKVRIVLGKYKTKRVPCNVSACSHSGDRRFATWEEKRTDVNIAIHILDDAYQDNADIFVIVSGDSDLVPAVHQVKLRFPDKKIVTYIPARNKIRGAAVEMRSAADKDATLPQNLLKLCHLPHEVSDGTGGTIRKPESW